MRFRGNDYSYKQQELEKKYLSYSGEERPEMNPGQPLALIKGWSVGKMRCMNCQKEFYFEVESYNYGLKYCSRACANSANGQRRKAQRHEAWNKACACCGKQFTAKRLDAEYCSAASKQAAYRARKERGAE